MALTHALQNPGLLGVGGSDGLQILRFSRPAGYRPDLCDQRTRRPPNGASLVSGPSAEAGELQGPSPASSAAVGRARDNLQPQQQRRRWKLFPLQTAALVKARATTTTTTTTPAAVALRMRKPAAHQKHPAR
uniref:MMS1_N domain-containing protein n=1 Tax=Globodera pallida TaxID=36090 RepID=A0A183BZV2_GLOPA